VVVHVLHPDQESIDVPGEGRLADAVNADAVANLLDRELTTAARQHVDLHTIVREPLGELANVTSEPSLDDRRILPGDHQDTHG
jgi:hypothetical protein